MKISKYPIVYVFTILLLMNITNITAQNKLIPEEQLNKVKWITLKEALELNKKQKKTFLIDIYTDWCGWCKHMMRTTFADPNIASYINNYFYPVRFNAETKDTVEFLGEKYINQGNGARSPHDLAIKWMEGRMSYPTILFFNNDFQFRLLVPGYMDVSTIEPYLVYTVENVFRTTSPDNFNKLYKKAFRDTNFTDTASIKWMNIQKLLDIQNPNKKK